MPYPQYKGPNKPDKGHEGGSCNRSMCQDSPANWYNHGSMKWYCDQCRIDIGFDPVNLRDWNREWKPKVGHAMFETRAMMDARK